jgi:hypothetical protein
MNDAAIPPGWHMRCTDEYGDRVPLHYVRSDGARVCLANDDYWANPNLPGYRAWCVVMADGCAGVRKRPPLAALGRARTFFSASAGCETSVNGTGHPRPRRRQRLPKVAGSSCLAPHRCGQDGMQTEQWKG